MNKNIVLIGTHNTALLNLGGLLDTLGYTNIIKLDKEVTYKVKVGDLIIFADEKKEAPEVLEAQAISATKVKGSQPPFSYTQFIGEVTKFFDTIIITETSVDISNSINLGSKEATSTTSALTNTFLQHDEKYGLTIIEKHYKISPHQAILTDIKAIFDYIFYGKIVLRDETLRKKYHLLYAIHTLNNLLYCDIDYIIMKDILLDDYSSYQSHQDYFNLFADTLHKAKGPVFAIANTPGVQEMKPLFSSLQEIFSNTQDRNTNIGENTTPENPSLILTATHTILGKDIS